MADEGFRDRLAKQGEDALGKLAQELLENPLVNGAISRAFEAREKATQAQEAALGALNIPSAADVERLTRRLRSVSQRLEGIEDGVDRLDQRLADLKAADGNPLASARRAAGRDRGPARQARRRRGAAGRRHRRGARAGAARAGAPRGRQGPAAEGAQAAHQEVRYLLGERREAGAAELGLGAPRAPRRRSERRRRRVSETASTHRGGDARAAPRRPAASPPPSRPRARPRAAHARARPGSGS